MRMMHLHVNQKSNYDDNEQKCTTVGELSDSGAALLFFVLRTRPEFLLQVAFVMLPNQF